MRVSMPRADSAKPDMLMARGNRRRIANREELRSSVIDATDQEVELQLMDTDFNSNLTIERIRQLLFSFSKLIQIYIEKAFCVEILKNPSPKGHS